MKKYLALLVFLPVIFFIASCTDSTTDPTPATEYGSFYLQTNPSYAQFFVDADTQFKVSNEDTVKNLTVGTHTIVVKNDNYADTTFTVTISANKLTTSTITLSPKTVVYGPIKIWETTGTGVSQPSGLILSTGTTASSSSAAIDMLYYSNSASSIYDLRSSDLITSTARKTRFKAAGTSNITDGVAAPAFDAATWTNKIPDRDTTQYYYVYDFDGHYAKVKVASYGDNSGQEAYVNVQIVYNKAVGEKRFK
jgi:hypothetical protein